MQLERYVGFLIALIFVVIMGLTYLLSAMNIDKQVFSHSHFGLNILSNMDEKTFTGKFMLEDHEGHYVTSASMGKKLKFVYFGFTHCSEVCPLTLKLMADAYNVLPVEYQSMVVPVFISIDPFRDSPSDAQNYAQVFHQKFKGLSGSEGQIKTVAEQYRVFAQKVNETYVDDKLLDYQVNHTSFVYIVGYDDIIMDAFTAQSKPIEISEKIMKIIDEYK